MLNRYPAITLLLAVACGIVPVFGLPALPEGPGLAVSYPGDAGIDTDPGVLFHEDFEAYAGDRINWSDLGGWDNVYGNMIITRTAANVNHGSQAVEIVHTLPQSHGVVKQVDGCETMFVRYYMKVHAQFPGCHHTGMLIRGGYDDDLFNDLTGVKPDGTNHFVALFDHLSPLHSWVPAEDDVPPGWSYMYTYHMDQVGGYGDIFLPDGRYNGGDIFADDPDFTSRPLVVPLRDRWYCYELMLQCNTVGQADGRAAFWIDGVLCGDWPHLRFRSAAALKARFASICSYSSLVNPNKTMWYDDVVIAKAYIGPISDGGNQPPTVDAGGNQTITLPDNDVSLDATVTDPDDTPATVWTKHSGPGTVTFGNAAAVDTTATFSTAGSYVLRLTADDGTNPAVSDMVTVVANPDPADDSDSDGMDDDWETEHFGDLSHDGADDADTDGLTDLEEYQQGTDPDNADTDGDGLSDGTDPYPLIAAGSGGTVGGCITDLSSSSSFFVLVLALVISFASGRSYRRRSGKSDTRNVA